MRLILAVTALALWSALPAQAQQARDTAQKPAATRGTTTHVVMTTQANSTVSAARAAPPTVTIRPTPIAMPTRNSASVRPVSQTRMRPTTPTAPRRSAAADSVTRRRR